MIMAARSAAASWQRGRRDEWHPCKRGLSGAKTYDGTAQGRRVPRREPLSRLVAILCFETPAVAGHREAEGEIDQRDEYIDFDAEGLPGRIDDRGLGGRQEIEEADDQDQAGILEECDERIHQWRDAVGGRLRREL